MFSDLANMSHYAVVLQAEPLCVHVTLLILRPCDEPPIYLCGITW